MVFVELNWCVKIGKVMLDQEGIDLVNFWWANSQNGNSLKIHRKVLLDQEGMYLMFLENAEVIPVMMVTFVVLSDTKSSQT